MDGGVTTCSPTSAVVNKRGMINIADKELAAGNRSLHLSVTLEAEIHIALHEHFRIDGAMRAVADGATLAQSGVFEDVRPGFFPVTSSTILVAP